MSFGRSGNTSPSIILTPPQGSLKRQEPALGHFPRIQPWGSSAVSAAKDSVKSACGQFLVSQITLYFTSPCRTGSLCFTFTTVQGTSTHYSTKGRAAHLRLPSKLPLQLPIGNLDHCRPPEGLRFGRLGEKNPSWRQTPRRICSSSCLSGAQYSRSAARSACSSSLSKISIRSSDSGSRSSGRISAIAARSCG